MSSKPFQTPSRRLFLTGSAAILGAPALAQVTADPDADPVIDPLRPAAEAEAPVRRNISAFRAKNWQPYFDNLRGGAILVDIDSRALHYWSADGATYKLFPSSVPVSDDLTRRGRTSIIRKVEGPSWSPTPNMRKRNPEWPSYVPPGPDNPLGSHALYLSWKYYRIHGTHDTRKIGRKSSNGCIGLYNEHIAQLFGMAKIGTQVLLI
ncbi:L,D-transpeptidase [Parasedimentitalea maritima]|uniref:L,D-transpeptidase n=1 Tax=Parasedimentitalea maritima TaxID=2578117 RepID=A0A5R8ZIS4_9RHOB|nr:L,D-transpeptidase family protein [Zongyanglinia marina]KAE9630890.1 L,D-transpeptidase family protein [Zongyanglinia marina]TLP65673.1 L,D-transpeptidase [Zongyanglinia marina]